MCLLDWAPQPCKLILFFCSDLYLLQEEVFMKSDKELHSSLSRSLEKEMRSLGMNLGCGVMLKVL